MARHITDKNTNTIIPVDITSVGTNDVYTILNDVFKKIGQDTFYDTTVSSNRIAKYNISIPKGVYYVRTADLFNVGDSVRTQNVTIDFNNSSIIFEGFSGDCFYNNDKFLNVTFEKANFYSKNDGLERTFMKSNSNGGAQNIVYNRCHWNGTFKYVFGLIGSNTNSEFVFNHCGMFGSWDSFLYIGSTGTSDQFLNYWFNNCRYWCSSNWITSYKGGHFKLNHCDVSGYEPFVDTYLFDFKNTSGAYGVQTFIDKGTRYELKSSQAKVIRCIWDNAHVNFDTCDFSSNAFNVIQRDDVFVFNNATTGGTSNYSMTNCQVLGQISLSNNNNTNVNGLFIQNCTLIKSLNMNDINSFFKFTTGVNTSEHFDVLLKNVKVVGDNRIYNHTIKSYTKSKATLQRTVYKQMSAYGTVMPDWVFKVTQPTLINNIDAILQRKQDGSTYAFHLKSDVTTVVSASGTRVKVANMKNVLYGNVLTLGTSDTLYTVTAIDHQFSEFVLDKTVTGVNAGDVVSLCLVSVFGYVPVYGHKIFNSNNSKYIVDSDVYLKNIGQTLGVSGIPGNILVDVTE